MTLASSLYMKVEDASLRWDAIYACLDGSKTKLHQLQRTLALVSSGISDLDHIEFDIGEVLKRLDDPDFTIQPDTDYYNLAALTSTLSLAIGDWDKPDVTDRNPGAAPRDADIDAVVQKLRGIGSHIHYKSMNNAAPLMAARSQLGNLEEILLRIARSREPPELGIISSPGVAARRDLPRQRNFMQDFLGKARSRPLAGTEGAGGTNKKGTSERGRLVRFQSEENDESMAVALAQQIEHETALAVKDQSWDGSTNTSMAND